MTRPTAGAARRRTAWTGGRRSARGRGARSGADRTRLHPLVSSPGFLRAERLLERWGAPLVTEVEPLERFWSGEAEHQDYFARAPWSGYCRVVIAPKVAKFRKTYADRLKRPAA